MSGSAMPTCAATSMASINVSGSEALMIFLCIVASIIYQFIDASPIDDATPISQLPTQQAQSSLPSTPKSDPCTLPPPDTTTAPTPQNPITQNHTPTTLPPFSTPLITILENSMHTTTSPTQANSSSTPSWSRSRTICQIKTLRGWKNSRRGRSIGLCWWRRCWMRMLRIV